MDGSGVERRRAAVIGAGVVGVATALRLRRAGWDVDLYDRDGPAAGASAGNGGVLAAAAVVPVTTPGLPLAAPRMLASRDAPLFVRWRRLPAMLPWLARYLRMCTAARTRDVAAALAPLLGDTLSEHQALAAGSQAAAHVAPCHYAYLYRDRAAFDADRFGWDLRAAHGVRWTELEGPAVRDWDPLFGPQIGFAAVMGGHGRIDDPEAYVRALAAQLQAEGGRVLRGAVTDVAVEAGRAVGVVVGGETRPADAVALCAGAWSGPLARRLGVAAPLESERGYHLELWGPSAMPARPCMVAAGKFVATPMTGRLRLAGVVEFGGLDAPPSAAPVALLRRAILAAAPGLRWERETQWMGHRPAPADSIPLIGPSPTVAGAWLGFGHHHVGLTGGPKTGRLLAQMIDGAVPNIDLSPYAPARFAAR